MPRFARFLIVVSAVLPSGMGCVSSDDKPVQAILRVNRDSFSGTSNDFMIYRETQASLLKSPFVIESALNDPALQAEQLDAHSVASSIQVRFHENSELLMVEMQHPQLDRPQSAKVLNSVLDAYRREIVAKERIEMVEALTKLRSRYRQLFELVKKKSDEVTNLARTLGSLEDAQVRTMQSIKIAKINHLQSMLTKLELKRIKWKTLENKVNEEVAEAQIQSLQESYESTLEEVQKLGGTQGELEARRDDLAAHRADLQAIRVDVRELELKLDGPAPVTIIQRPH